MADETDETMEEASEVQTTLDPPFPYVFMRFDPLFLGVDIVEVDDAET